MRDDANFAPMKSSPSTREMQRAFLAGDASYDGVFVTGVRTTGIFCRPSCPARKPRPENVEFFPTPKEAAFSGYRPCKRCRPLDVEGRGPVWVQTLIRKVERDPGARLPARELKLLGIDPARARRYFLKHFGMTFQAYCRSRRLSGAFQRIKEGATVNQAMGDAGFGSESGFRSAFGKLFGSAPSAAKDRNAIHLDWLETPIGPLVAGATQDALCLLEFSDRRMLEAQLETLKRRFGSVLLPGSNRVLAALRAQLAEYFAGQRQAFDLPLDYRGTPFQQKVWQGLLEIPYGETCSYRDLAKRVGDRDACRAVGTANGMNRIAIIIPCHRVVNANGALGGYGGGLWRKQFLLDLERGQGRLGA